MTISSHKFRFHLGSLEKHLAGQAEQREDKAIAAHLAAVTASIGAPTSLRYGGTDPTPYRRRIVLAFIVFAVALATLTWWHAFQ